MAYRDPDQHHRVDVHVHFADPDPRLDQVIVLLKRVLAKEKIIMSALTDLQTEVEADVAVGSSAITLLNGLKAALDEAIASGDPAALQALSDQLGSSRQALADAITANTPAAAEPPAEPTA